MANTAQRAALAPRAFVFYTLTLNDFATWFRARSFSRERVSHRARHGVDDGFLSRAVVFLPSTVT